MSGTTRRMYVIERDGKYYDGTRKEPKLSAELKDATYSPLPLEGRVADYGARVLPVDVTTTIAIAREERADEEEAKRQITKTLADLLRSNGTNPCVVYAFEQVGLLIHEESEHAPEHRRAWDEAVAAYLKSHPDGPDDGARYVAWANVQDPKRER